MRLFARGPFAIVLATVLSTAAAPALAGPASGSVKSPTGTITPTQAIAYAVRDGRDTRIEIMLTDVPVNASGLADDLDRHARAINFDELRDRNYVLLWVASTGVVTMNATYSKTMTQYMNFTSGMGAGLKAELTTNTATKVEGRVFSPSPVKTMDGDIYTVDLKFSADVIPALTGTPLPAGGGDPAKALTAFLAAVKAKNWSAIKAGFSPKTLPMWDKDYNTPKENADSVADIFAARLPLQNLKITTGQLINPTTALLEVEGERFGSKNLSLVKMVKTGATWQYDDSAPAGMVR